ncbi:MAG: hypothetical protein ACON49_00550 [Candidatus Puniceispirillaceae bacterium]
MKRAALLSSILMTLSFTTAHALECTRTSLDHRGFGSKRTAESWYPKDISIANDKFEDATDGSEKMVFRLKTSMSNGTAVTVLLRLLPDGNLISSLQQRSGYQAPGMARYRCDLTPDELRRLSSASATKTAPKPKQTAKSTTVKADDKLSKAKSTCQELGFAAKTEKFGDCVMKMLDYKDQ